MRKMLLFVFIIWLIGIIILASTIGFKALSGLFFLLWANNIGNNKDIWIKLRLTNQHTNKED